MSLIERHEQVLDKCVESLKIWNELITEYLDGEDKDAELKKLKQVTKEHCGIESDFQRSMNVLHKVEEQLNEDDTSTKDVQKLFDENLSQEPEISEEDYIDNEIWQKIFRGRSDVVEVRQRKRKVDNTQFEELGDSLLCSNVFTPPIDPITKTVIRNPYKSRKCKHVYEYSTIVGYIKQQRRKAKCPYIGCKGNRLLIDDLVEDVQLQSQITEYLETQREEESEDEED